MALANLIPDRKVLAGGVSSVAAWGVTQVAVHYGVPITPEMQGYVAAGFGWLIAYLVPAAQRDVLRHLNDELVKFAQNDPRIPVTKPKAS